MKILKEGNHWIVYDNNNKIVGAHTSQEEALRHQTMALKVKVGVEKPDIQDAELKLMQDHLLTCTIQQLDNWISSFMSVGLHVPRMLWEVLEYKKEKESLLYLRELIKEIK